jgi:hypothetical protein
VHALGSLVDIALGIQEAMVFTPRQSAVDHFEAADLDDAVALAGSKAGGFRV